MAQATEGDQQKKKKAQILALRRKHLCGALSLSYSEPLLIERGKGAYLFDESGRPYLDLVNNVCHVGHCHPRVVKAACEQLAILNTNTRYLHDNIIELSQRLTETMPKGSNLCVCFFVNSGSEANDLALRLARTHTNAKDVISLASGYHGNTQALIEISPYKYEGKGGFVPPEYSHRVELPDPYRGIYRSRDAEAGKKYAELVAHKIRELQSKGRKLAAFIAESIVGCGGQVVLPDNYLKEAHMHVRAAGGVCIADEVQTGFGRVGTHFWAFETQGVVPDIVTLGKPFGNGYPLAGVVTTPEIAASFAATGMEYFNTFGGSPVSCAVGLAVLDVIRDEQLQLHAREVGTYMATRLTALSHKYSIIGDVRGFGLFLGVEFVRDRVTLEPADRETKVIVEQMKKKGVLLGIDGPFHNVVKVKPPMVLTKKDVNFFVDALDEVLVSVDRGTKTQRKANL
jgi:4-aminobutyrate aminotransferase-like enzyme